MHWVWKLKFAAYVSNIYMSILDNFNNFLQNHSHCPKTLNSKNFCLHIFFGLWRPLVKTVYDGSMFQLHFISQNKPGQWNTTLKSNMHLIFWYYMSPKLTLTKYWVQDAEKCSFWKFWKILKALSMQDKICYRC